MKAKVLISFCGAVSASMGDVIDIADDFVYQDLLRAGYIASLEASPTADVPAPKKTTRKKAVKG